jgi:hypothetical protein
MMIFNESQYKNTFCADSSDSDSRYTVRKTYLLKSKAKKLQNRIFIILLQNHKYYILLSNQQNRHYILCF